MTPLEYLATIPTLSDAEAADAMNAATETRVVMRFGSFRTLASILTVEEYATVRSTLDAAAAQSVMVADAVSMLKLPGSEDGSGGGIDLGNATVRGMVDSLFSAEIAAKIKAYAEDSVRSYPFPQTWNAQHVRTLRDGGSL